MEMNLSPRSLIPQTLLENAVLFVVAKKVSFSSLTTFQKRKVMLRLVAQGQEGRILGKKWYDLLTNKFFVEEYSFGLDGSYETEPAQKEFDSFSLFYEYVDGDIYQNSSFFGYRFSKEDIETFWIDLSRLNFGPPMKRTLSEFSFESIRERRRKQLAQKVKQAKFIEDWFANYLSDGSLKQMEQKLKLFKERFSFSEANKVFFSLLLQKERDNQKEAAIQFLCKHDIWDGLPFGKILLIYGPEAASRVIREFDGSCSYKTKAKRIRSFKEELEVFQSNSKCTKRELGYDESIGLYYVKDSFWERGTGFENLDYFLNFQDFVSFAYGDLSNADLENAPVPRREVTQYGTNEKTKLPIGPDYAVYQEKKEYTGADFLVEQKWFDSNGNLALNKQHHFSTFRKFLWFLEGDLSGADLSLLEELEPLPENECLNLSDVKLRAGIAKNFDASQTLLPPRSLDASSFDIASRNETKTLNCFALNRPIDESDQAAITYVSDIHLVHRFLANNCKTIEDVRYVIGMIASNLANQAEFINLLGGDISSDFAVFQDFVRRLLAHHHDFQHFFFTLGNHELWGHPNQSLKEITDEYRNFLHGQSENAFLVQNNIFYFSDRWREIPEEDLSALSESEIHKRTRDAFVVVFGGIGFSGKNEKFNADNGIYRGAIDRQTEIEESEKFQRLYEKVTNAVKGKNLIVFTHMPLTDWAGKNANPKEGVIYVSGHDHRNYYFDDGRTRVYSDNQIGYRGKAVGFKRIPVSYDYDWFQDYADGIYEISKKDYERFYWGIQEPVRLMREFDKLFMIKREGNYMFFIRSKKGRLQILNGGAIKGANNHTLRYYYHHISNYSKSIRLFLSSYDAFQKQVAQEIRRIGGAGRIHGSIVDIDFYNHVFINPIDNSITAYYADSIDDKCVYYNFPSLLKARCPELYRRYANLLVEKKTNNELVLFDRKHKISDRYFVSTETDYCRISRIVKGLQYTTNHNVVRIWNDSFAEGTSAEAGRLIVSNVIYPKTISENDNRISDDSIDVVGPKKRLKTSKPIKTKKMTQASLAAEETGNAMMAKSLKSAKPNGLLVDEKSPKDDQKTASRSRAIKVRNKREKIF